MRVKDWSVIKRFLDERGKHLLQWVETDDLYEITCYDKNFKLEYTLYKSTSDTSDLSDFENNYKIFGNKKQDYITILPFGSKDLLDGSKIFRRVHGISSEVNDELKIIDFIIPYPKCKITGVQILNGKLGDKVNFKVLDDDLGTISGIANAQLNQFGFDVNILPDIASYPSKYDADLIKNMIIRLEYDAINTGLPKTVYINFDLHEVKS